MSSDPTSSIPLPEFHSEYPLPVVTSAAAEMVSVNVTSETEGDAYIASAEARILTKNPNLIRLIVGCANILEFTTETDRDRAYALALYAHELLYEAGQADDMENIFRA